MQVADVAKLGLHGTLSRPGRADPPCLIDIRREYSAFVLFVLPPKPVFRRSLKSLRIACPVPPSHSLIHISARSSRVIHTLSPFA
jgi:hypothetical protein